MSRSLSYVLALKMPPPRKSGTKRSPSCSSGSVSRLSVLKGYECTTSRIRISRFTRHRHPIIQEASYTRAGRDCCRRTSYKPFSISQATRRSRAWWRTPSWCRP
ncbi:hypothetical protein PsYK624_147930 [Phanerochaete sordida]|uniref:Uncharacterized protein n=1 Tax=Phanerochaete sordida TaxID=48140 RepID=A0A9P3LKP5_9APHY|nr:hypothetical protein PsYK624_147930 [Phanerochaete sordida]